MSENHDEIIRVTAIDLITSWEVNLKARMDSEDFHRLAYEERSVFYDAPVTFEQYIALSAYVDCLWPGNIDFTTTQERAEAYEGSFGTLYENMNTDQLQSVLDDHHQAMSKAYEAEVLQALDGVDL